MQIVSLLLINLILMGYEVYSVKFIKKKKELQDSKIDSRLQNFLALSG